MSPISIPHGRLTAGRAFLFSAAATLLTTTAFARGVLVSPTQLGISGKPGETVSGVLYVSSSKEEKNRVTTQISDFMRDEEGTVVETKPHARSARTWIDLDRTEFTSPESGRIAVTVTARIPQDATGSYWALVYVQSDVPPREVSRGAALRVVPRVGIPVIVSVAGTTKPQLKIVETRAVRTAEGVDFYSLIENTGNTAVLVSGAFALERSAGGSTAAEELASSSVGPITSLPGTRLRTKSSVKYTGAVGDVQARAYLRWGPRPEDSAEAATTIESMKSAVPLAKKKS